MVDVPHKTINEMEQIEAIDDELTGTGDKLTGANDKLTVTDGKLAGTDGKLIGTSDKLTGTGGEGSNRRSSHNFRVNWQITSTHSFNHESSTDETEENR